MGAACGIFMMCYAVYYWFYTAQMSGSLQFSMYFGYTFMMSYAVCLMLAAVGHWSSQWFVVRIYNAIKSLNLLKRKGKKQRLVVIDIYCTELFIFILSPQTLLCKSW